MIINWVFLVCIEGRLYNEYIRISICNLAAHKNLEIFACQKNLQHLPFFFVSGPLSPAHIAPHLSIHIVAFIYHMSSFSKLINAVVLLILLTALSDPEQYHLTSAELANDLDVMDDASK